MTTYGPYAGIVVEIHDADTFRVVCVIQAPPGDSLSWTDIGWDVSLHPGETARIVVDVRLWGCNAAELETPAGKLALAYLQRLMPVGTPVTLLSHGYDKYGGRSDCSITLPDGRDLTAVMIAANAAAPFSGEGPKPVPVGPIKEQP